jgi:hypothetical protein
MTLIHFLLPTFGCCQMTVANSRQIYQNIFDVRHQNLSSLSESMSILHLKYLDSTHQFHFFSGSRRCQVLVDGETGVVNVTKRFIIIDDLAAK